MNDFIAFSLELFFLQLVIGILITAFVAFVLYRKPFNATTRHNIWCIVLAGIVLMPFLSVFTQTESNTTGFNPWSALENPVTTVQQLSQQERMLLNEASVAARSDELSLENKAASNLLKGLGWFNLNLIIGIFLASLVLLAIIKSLLLYRTWAALRNLVLNKNSAQPTTTELFKQCAMHLGIKKIPDMGASSAIQSPIVIGILKPSVLIPKPVDNGENVELLEQVFLHELAHVRRRDPLVAMLQSLVSIFLFWHPAIYYINRQILNEREMACDDCVVTQKPMNASVEKSYANNLLSLVEQIQKEKKSLLAVACVRNNQQIVERVKRILNKNINHSTKGSILLTSSWSLILSVALLLTLPLWPQIPSAQMFSAKPVFHLLADSIETDENDYVTTLRGNVMIQYSDSATLRGEEIEVHGFVPNLDSDGPTLVGDLGKIIANKPTMLSINKGDQSIQVTSESLRYERGMGNLTATNATVIQRKLVLFCGELKGWISGISECSRSPRVIKHEGVASRDLELTGNANGKVALSIRRLVNLLHPHIIIGDTVEGDLSLSFNGSLDIYEGLVRETDLQFLQVDNFIIVARAEEIKQIYNPIRPTETSDALDEKPMSSDTGLNPPKVTYNQILVINPNESSVGGKNGVRIDNPRSMPTFNENSDDILIVRKFNTGESSKDSTNLGATNADPSMLQISDTVLAFRSSIEYPQAAIDEGMEGRARIRFAIGKENDLKELVWIKRSGHQALDSAIIKAISGVLRHQTLDKAFGKAQTIVVELPIIFELSE